MARKTINVAELHESCNRALASSESMLRLADSEGQDYTPAQAYRMGVAMVLEHVLHKTGNYRGFTYLDEQYNHDPADPGVGTTTQDGRGVLRTGYDNTRRVYL